MRDPIAATLSGQKNAARTMTRRVTRSTRGGNFDIPQTGEGLSLQARQVYRRKYHSTNSTFRIPCVEVIATRWLVKSLREEKLVMSLLMARLMVCMHDRS
jgi:hypothetical protein